MRLVCDDEEDDDNGRKKQCQGGWYRDIKNGYKQYSGFLKRKEEFEYAFNNNNYCLGCRLIAIKIFLERYK